MVGINKEDFVLGIPSIVLPVPNSVPFKTPELAIVKNARSQGLGAIALTAFERESGKHVASFGPVVGETVHSDLTFMGIRMHWERRHLPDELRPVEEQVTTGTVDGIKRVAQPILPTPDLKPRPDTDEYFGG